jgi:hypothetical protein
MFTEVIAGKPRRHAGPTVTESLSDAALDTLFREWRREKESRGEEI